MILFDRVDTKIVYELTDLNLYKPYSIFNLSAIKYIEVEVKSRYKLIGKAILVNGDFLNSISFISARNKSNGDDNNKKKILITFRIYNSV